MEGKFSIPKRIEDVPRFGEFLRQILADKEMSYQELADKLQVTVEEVMAYDDLNSAPSVEILKKMSGILGIRYSILRISACYNLTQSYPDFYLPDGTEIDHNDLLDQIYYRDPSILPRLLEVLFGN